jgi:protoporphyrinogen oxidase
LSFEILESSDGIGGRVRTDCQDGYLLDRGFQVLSTAYPEALDQLNYEALGLRPFVSGALIRYHGRFVRLTDPWRERGAFLNNLRSSAVRRPRPCRLFADVVSRCG